MPDLRQFAKRYKVLLLFLAALIIIALVRVGLYLYKPDAAARPGQIAVYVELGEARFGSIRNIGIYYGSVVSPYQFTVSPKIGGQLERLFVNIGDAVSNGQVVAQLDDELLILARQQATQAVALAVAQYDEATANLNLARRNMERQTRLKQEKIVPVSEFEATQTSLAQAEARLAVSRSQRENAKSQLEDAELKLSYAQVVATWPEKGSRYIGARMAEEGTLVTANTPLVTVVSLDPLLVVADVIEQDYQKVHVGQSVQIHVKAMDGEIFMGQVVRVAPVLSPATRQARVEIEVSNPDLRLKPGMFAQVDFVFSEHKEVWSVPDDVPLRRKDGFVIFVADAASSTVREVPVGLGLTENGYVELTGVSDINGPVVFIGQHLLENGRHYRVPGASPASAGKTNPDKKPEENTNNKNVKPGATQ